MDFAEIDLEGWADEGAEMQVQHPVTDEPLFDNDGNPVTIWVKGLESPEAKSIAKSAAANMQNGNVKKLEKEGMDLLVKITAKWQGIGWEGKELDSTEKNKRFFYGKREWVGLQVLNFAKDRRNFFNEASKD
jgi:hypothetical protein